MVLARLQRWALTLGTCSYAIKYKSGKQQGNADTLYRFLLPDSPASVPIPAETVAIMKHLSTIPLTDVKIKQATECDPTLSKVKHYTYIARMAIYSRHS